MKLIIAIDGPAGSGKSTLATLLARAYGLTKVDTGALYRAVALAASRRGVPWEDGDGVAALVRSLSITQTDGRTFVEGEDVSEDIRSPRISEGSSVVSVHPQVRGALLELQRTLARTSPRGAVLEGRDIGTVVLPDATIKFFLTADVGERGRRRLRDLEGAGLRASLEEVIRDIVERDKRDQERATAPLRAAEDALVIDTTALKLEEVLGEMMAVVRACLEEGGGKDGDVLGEQPQEEGKDMEIGEILEELRLNRGIFPQAAMEAAVARREEIAPHLLRILEETLENPVDAARRSDYFAVVYALFLLAQFRDARAYPLAVRLARLPSKILDALLGDVITEDLSSILASLYDGDLRPIEKLIQDRKADEYARASGVKALNILYFQGKIPRDDLVSCHQRLFRGALEREYSDVWNELVCCAIDIYPAETERDIRQAFEDDLVDVGMVEWESVEKALDQPMEGLLAERREGSQGLIGDTMEEMRGWGRFTPDAPQDEPEIIEEPVVIIPKAGRNDPCPCGSGRKYKKCCGR